MCPLSSWNKNRKREWLNSGKLIAYYCHSMPFIFPGFISSELGFGFQPLHLPEHGSSVSIVLVVWWLSPLWAVKSALISFSQPSPTPHPVPFFPITNCQQCLLQSPIVFWCLFLFWIDIRKNCFSKVFYTRIKTCKARSQQQCQTQRWM